MPLEDPSSVIGLLSALDQRLTDHTSQDETNFSRIIDKVEVLDNKLDQLLIRESGREGEVRGTRRSVYAVAAIISIIISAAGVTAAALL